MLEVDIEGVIGTHELQIELSVEDGQCLALAGPSGSGKTTLLRMIAGLHPPRRGKIVLGDEILLDTRSRIDQPTELRRCGFVFQHFALFPHLSAWRNVAYAVDGSAQERRARAIELLTRLNAAELADALPRQLSGGERQRVALARAVASDPKLLLFDEPLGALDVQNRALAAEEVISAVAELNVLALLVTHDFFEAALLGDSIAVLDEGCIVQSGTAADLTARPSTAFVADLTGANLLHGTAAKIEGGITEVMIDGGGRALSTDEVTGEVVMGIQPWELVLESADSESGNSSMQNRLSATVASNVTVGNRVRIGLQLPQPITAEVTQAAAAGLDLVEGTQVFVSFKASAVRLYPR